jgi:hypothetical protein
MTSLQEQVLVLQASIDNVQSELNQVRKDKLAAHIKVMAPFLKVFPEEIETTVTESGVYFKEQGKELFNIYFDRSWSSSQVLDLQLNYYTRIVGSKDAFELKRLSLLGYAADVVAFGTQEIITKLNEASVPFDQQSQKLYEELSELSKSQKRIESAILSQKKEEIKQQLFRGDTITFDKRVFIDMKYNYRATLYSIKLQDISKSGKTATAIYNLINGKDVLGREENINVGSILDQIVYNYSDNIVSALELV